MIDAVTRSQDEFDIERALTVAAQVERETGNVELRMRARLLRQNALERKGEVGPAARLAWEVNRWAADHDHRDLLAQSHWQLSRSYHYLGDTASCLDHAVRAVELLDDDAPPLQRGRFLVTLADALGWARSFEEARRRYASAEEIYISLGDVPRHIMVLNNLAYTEYEAGEPERAWAVAQRMQAVAAAHGMPLKEIYHDAVARAQIGIGRPGDAERTLSAVLAEYAPASEEADLLAELLLTLAEAQRLCGGTDRAQETLDRCLRLCEQRGLAEVRVRALREQAELHAARGDFESAYATHKEFYAAAEALRSEEREARARIREAMFETAEARQDARRFWEQARRDPLTGLHNRRYADERLPVLLAHAAQHGEPLAAALIDIDHFKRINDRLSHEVGDRVLAIVAELLATAAAAFDDDDAVLVARMGGEEFLLVLPGSTAEAAGRLEEVRLAVHSYPWQPITGALPVTVSIGAAPALPDSTQSTLLARADAQLYAAKNAGRDRLMIENSLAP
nr:GGDEF domain-containing protein [Planosporangium thailandense]